MSFKNKVIYTCDRCGVEDEGKPVKLHQASKYYVGPSLPDGWSSVKYPTSSKDRDYCMACSEVVRITLMGERVTKKESSINNILQCATKKSIEDFMHSVAMTGKGTITKDGIEFTVDYTGDK